MSRDIKKTFFASTKKHIRKSISVLINNFKRGDASHDNKEYSLPLEDDNKFIELNPEDSKFYYIRGNINLDKNEYDLALEDYSKYIELDAKYVDVYYKRGICYYAKKEFDLAIDDFNKCIELNSEYLYAYEYRGFIYYSKKKYDLALEDFNKCIELNPSIAKHYSIRGFVNLKKKQYNLALEDFNKCIELNPENSKYYYSRGHYYLDKKEYDLALEDYNRCIELDAKNIKAYDGRGVCYDRKEEYDLALENYNKCVELNSEYINVYYNRALLYKVNRRYNLAIEDYNKYIELNPEDAGVYYILGEIYHTIEEYSKMSLYYDLSLYYSYKSKRFKLENKLINYWDNKPYNFVFITENMEVGYTSFSKSHYDVIKNIENYYSFLSKCTGINKRQKENNRAILNYYLGSPVASFIHYDEVLNTKHLPLSSQGLYYYALTSKNTQIETNVILIDCINKLSNNLKQTIHDKYYLGQLYLLNENIKDAHICFNNSIEFTPSLIMLLSIEDNDNNKQILFENVINNKEAKLFLTGIKEQQISLENTFQKQFQNYFYTKELLSAVQIIKNSFDLPDDLKEYTSKELWETFYLTGIEKEKLYLKLREKEIENVITSIVDEIKLNTNKIELNKKQSYLLNIKELLLSKQDYDIRLVIKDLLESENKKEEDIENLLGMMIKDFRLGQSNIYGNFISYAYLKGSINAYQSFVLFVYLIDIICTKKSINIQDSIRTIIPTDKSKLFLVSLGLSGGLFGIVNIIKACEILMHDFESYEFKNETHYMSFKGNLWKYISLNKETMSEAKFEKKFECFPSIIKYNIEKS